jgi:hypothetical protein
MWNARDLGRDGQPVLESGRVMASQRAVLEQPPALDWLAVAVTRAAAGVKPG